VEVPSTEEPLIVFGKISEFTSLDSDSKIIYFSMSVADYDTNSRNSLKFWPYFNYLMYVCSFYMNKNFDFMQIEGYGEWAYSPIPHESESTLWMIFVAAIFTFNFGLFFYLRRYKKPSKSSNRRDNLKIEKENNN
jgi:hypothetical protein